MNLSVYQSFPYHPQYFKPQVVSSAKKEENREASASFAEILQEKIKQHER